MLMLQTLNATAFIGGVLGALMVKWGQWVKDQQKGVSRWLYFQENLGEFLSSAGILGLIMVLWLSGHMAWIAKEFADTLPLGDLTFGEQIQVAAWSSFVVGFFGELLAPKLLLKVLGWVGIGKKVAPAVLLAFLIASPAMAAQGAFLEGSYFDLGGSRSTLSYETRHDPKLELFSSLNGFAFGGGYEFASGWSISAQWMHAREDMRAHWLVAPYGASAPSFDSDGSRDGFIISARMPLRLRKWICYEEGGRE